MNPPIPATTFDAASIEKIRSGQRFVLLAILLNILGGCVASPSVVLIEAKGDDMHGFFEILLGFILLLSMGGLLFSIIWMIAGVVRLISGFGYDNVDRFLIIISLLIPLINVLVLLVLSSKATGVLRSSGYEVGLLGAVPKAISIEFEFSAAAGQSYRIEGSTDAENWEIIEEGIQGHGTGISRLYSIRDQPHRFFQARTE